MSIRIRESTLLQFNKIKSKVLVLNLLLKTKIKQTCSLLSFFLPKKMEGKDEEQDKNELNIEVNIKSSRCRERPY